MICILTIFFPPPVRPNIAKNLQKLNLKIRRQIIIFEQKLLIFSENKDILTTDLPIFWIFKKSLSDFEL